MNSLTPRPAETPGPAETPRLPELQSLPDLNTRTLLYLREVARQPTFTDAAQALGVSQPALSLSLSNLESRMGIALFEQDGRLRRLTQAGKLVSDFAVEMLGRTWELRERLDAHRSGGAGLLRIGLIDAATLYLLPTALASFRAAFPEVRLSVVVEATDVLCDRLAEFDLDLAFCVNHERVGLAASPICTEALRVYAREPTEDPSEKDWALYPEGSRTRALINKGLAAAGVTAAVALESRNPEVLRQMAEVGLAWTVLPEAIGNQAWGLSEAFPEPVAVRPLVMMRRRGGAPDPRADSLEELAKKAVSQAVSA